MLIRHATVPLLLLAIVSPTEAAEYRVPRTAYGHPDLQGVWTNSTLSPVERLTSLGTKLVLTEQEARTMEAAMARRMAAADQPSDPGTQLRAGGDPGGYNTFWMDPGMKIAFVNGQFRSSITVEPANGRLPQFTPLGAKLASEINNAASERAFEGPEGRPLGERCLAAFGNASGPPMLGMDTLYARLRAAARSVCRDQIRRAPIELQTYPKCVSTALTNAIRSLDHQAFASYVADRKMKSSAG